MNNKAKAEELFSVIVKRRSYISKIPFYYAQGETGMLLCLTFEKNGLAPSILSEKMDISIPRVLSIVKSLQKKKLIEKQIDENDKRKSVIKITELGKKYVLDMKKNTISDIERIFNELSNEDINNYIYLTEKIGDIVKKMQK